jgi:transposase
VSLHPSPVGPIPEETARVARAAFPKGSVAIRIRDELGVLYRDEDFAPLFPARGQAAEAPWRLMLVTLLQFAENLTDRQAAEAVRSRIDWKYALALPLEDAGFDASVLSEFRTRLLRGEPERLLFDTLLDRMQAAGLLKARGRQRTDSTHVLAAVRALTRLGVVSEALRHALNSLAVVAPAWLRAQLQPDWDGWVERYGHPCTDYRLPRAATAQAALAEAIGGDGRWLLGAIYDPAAPPWLREVPAVETLRQVWVQQYHATPAGPPPGPPRWRGDRELPPANRLIQSPYDAEARFTTKRQTRWTGYKAHVTETCDPDEPHLVVHVATTAATTHDSKVTPEVHRDLAARDLLPAQHLADQGYVDSELLLTSEETFGVTLLGPVPADQSWQALAAQGFAVTDFVVDWEARAVRCPQGKWSTSWCPATDQYGDPVFHVNFGLPECAACPARARCTRSTTTGRKLTLRPRPKHEALVAARQRQGTAAFKAEYARRAGIEGTLAQGTRRFGLRRARYRGLPKTHLQHVLTAISLNLVRLVAWHDHPRHRQVRPSRFVALAAAA